MIKYDDNVVCDKCHIHFNGKFIERHGFTLCISCYTSYRMECDRCHKYFKGYYLNLDTDLLCYDCYNKYKDEKKCECGQYHDVI